MAAQPPPEIDAYRQMLCKFGVDAQRRHPDNVADFLFRARLELSELEGAVKTYITRHSGSFCDKCMWLDLATSSKYTGQLLPGWRLDLDHVDGVWKYRLDIIKLKLRDDAIHDVGAEQITYRCQSGEHGGLYSKSISEYITDRPGLSDVVKVKPSIVPPHRAVRPQKTSGPTANTGIAITQSTPTKLLPFSTKSPSAVHKQEPVVPDLRAIRVDHRLTRDLREILESSALKAIDANMETAEARVEALVQARVGTRLEKEKAKWEKGQAEKDEQREMELIEANAKREQDEAMERIQWEKSVRERIKVEMMESMTRALMK
jgi:hypothetical protein